MRSNNRTESKKNHTAETAEPEKWIRLLLNGTETVTALSELVRTVKKKAGRETVKNALKDGALLENLLRDDRPKVRKNTARLMGELEEQRYVPALATALSRETTLFVIPSMLLSLGNLGGSEAENALNEYAVPDAETEEQEHNLKEIRDALKKAKDRFRVTGRKMCTVLKEEKDILLVSPEGFSKTLKGELEENGFSPRMTENGCLVRTDRIGELYRIRCAMEILIPIGRNIPNEPERIAEAFMPWTDLPYRIEVRNLPNDRTRYIREIVLILKRENNPSSYDAEFRIETSDDGKHACLYVKLYNVPDERYDYRKHTVAASMHPALAACLSRYALETFGKKEGAVILDPCCGSGTLLFEREKLGGCSGLLGIDLKEEAVSAARENAVSGNSKAKFIQKDLRNFRIRVPADEIYANLPFGNRVGSHSDNESLYAELVNRIPSWIADDGFAVLYTMEYRLLKKLIGRSTELEEAGSFRTEAGGLLPTVFLVRKKK